MLWVFVLFLFVEFEMISEFFLNNQRLVLFIKYERQKFKIMKKEYKNLLVPVDFKAPSVKAFKYAYNLAQKINADVILLHVIQTPGILADFFSAGDKLVKIVNEANDKLGDLVEQVSKAGATVKIKKIVEKGKPYDKILHHSEKNNIRMIILGENHQGVGADQELGSTVYHVTLKSMVPVLTLKGSTEKMNDKILVPLDLTTQTRRQLFSALVYGLNYKAKIYLVSALIGGIKVRESRIFKKLKQAKNTLLENGVESHTKLFSRSTEPPFRKVMEYAKEIDAGMILVMTHKEGYTHDNYIGAFAHHIINKSEVPVLSLTSAATNIDYGKFIEDFVDPAGLLLKKK